MTNTQTPERSELPSLKRYAATINIPGYLPMADELAFESATDAWSYLASERERAEDDTDETGEYSVTVGTLLALANGRALPEGASCMVDDDHIGSVYGDTPGYDGSHDLGLTYSVTVALDLSAYADDVVKGYAVAMLWANAVCDVEDCEDREAGSDCEHVNHAHGTYSMDDFSPEDQHRLRADCYAMMMSTDDEEQDGQDFLAYCDARPILGRRAASHFGHDFALTRNHHGAGYWDRGLGALGDRLTANAHPFGESSVYVTEDGVSLS